MGHARDRVAALVVALVTFFGLSSQASDAAILDRQGDIGQSTAVVQAQKPEGQLYCTWRNNNSYNVAMYYTPYSTDPYDYWQRGGTKLAPYPSTIENGRLLLSNRLWAPTSGISRTGTVCAQSVT